MNDKLSTEELNALEDATAASEAQWLPLQHIAKTSAPAWKHAEETIDTQSSSIHGKGGK